MAGTKFFYDTIRQPLFNGTMSQSQVNGIEAILTAWENKGIKDNRYVAYGLATAYHETGHTMRPIEEYGKGKGYDYGKKLKRSRKPYTVPDKLYYGRGLVQLTWFENYDAVGGLIGQDLLNHPELALDNAIAAKILVDGMINGWFTGKRLYDYFNDKTNNPFNARKIINGLDRAKDIEHYYDVFLKGLCCE